MAMSAGQGSSQLELKPIGDPGEIKTSGCDCDLLYIGGQNESPYLAGFAVSRRCVEAALRLRYEIFNLELGEGLLSSNETGLDEDQFDAYMTHLVLVDRKSNSIVGTYRLQTMLNAQATSVGSYTGQEFDLRPLLSIASGATECGRACLARDHRNMRALTQLWLGIGFFMNAFRQQFLFGCCSLTTSDPEEGWRAFEEIRARGHLHPSYFVEAREPFRCVRTVELDVPKDGGIYRLPKLFRIYLKLGAKVLSEPALDRSFGTIDFLVMLNGRDLNMSSLAVVR